MNLKPLHRGSVSVEGWNWGHLQGSITGIFSAALQDAFVNEPPWVGMSEPIYSTEVEGSTLTCKVGLPLDTNGGDSLDFEFDFAEVFKEYVRDSQDSNGICDESVRRHAVLAIPALRELADWLGRQLENGKLDAHQDSPQERTAIPRSSEAG
jgi:hypothetical protein